MPKTPSQQRSFKASVRHLAEMFARNGCLRLPDTKRRKLEKQKYHAGYEVRLVALNEEDANLIRACLQTIKLSSGREFTKGNRLVFPIYGKDKVEYFCGLAKEFLPDLVVARKIRR